MQAGTHRSRKTRLRVAAAILRRDGRVLICQRARSGPYPLLWEFPGGKLEAGESEPQALARELEEELGLQLRPEQIGALVARLRHRYPRTGTVELAFYEVPDAGGEPRNRVFEAMAWERVPALSSYDFLPADQPLLGMLD
ncbi:MAG: (deoxy)nucleoside triphosphate pyrophosphohydrolase [Terriglobales bacterium]